MSRIRRFSCVILSFVIVVITAFSCALVTSAADRLGYVDATGVNLRSAPSTGSTVLKPGLSHVYVTILGEEKDAKGILWYKVRYENIEGYICSEYEGQKLIKIIEQTVDKDFEEQLKAFPASYHSALKALHAVYPNWQFHADNVNLTLDEAVGLEFKNTLKKVTETKDLSWRTMEKGSYNWGSNTWISMENNRWYYVSREVVKYYMDPRNFFNATYMYLFMKQNYDPSTQNAEGLKKIIKGTFLENGYNDPKDTAYRGSYVNVLMAAAQSSGVNPYILAASIIQEQGSAGKSEIIKGPYYNFFNIGANGNDPITNGLNYAKNRDWSTRSKSIIEGAKFCGNNYINAGQNTYYYINYNIKNNATHQYATAVQHAASSSYQVSKNYKDIKDAALDFLIPVYRNMGEKAAELPAKNDKLNNYFFNNLSVEGLTPTFDRFTYEYNLKVSGNTNVDFEIPSGATYAGSNSFKLKKGENKIILPVKSQTGYINNYIIYVNAANEATLTIGGNAPPPKFIRGDTNGDGIVNGRDAANVQLHILKIKSLTGDAFTRADTNGDGVVNGRDAANIQLHILRIKLLT